MKQYLCLALILALLLTMVGGTAFAEFEGLSIEGLELTNEDFLPSEGLALDTLDLADVDLVSELLTEGGDLPDEPEAQSPGTVSQSQANAAKKYKLSASSITIGVKEKYTKLKVTSSTGSASNASTPKITWRSANKKIARVNSRTGKIIGVKKGRTTIYAKIEGYEDEIKCKVKVLKAPRKSNFTVSPKNGSLKVGQTGQYTVDFDEGYGGGFTFSSSDTSIAVVDETGVVTAKNPGTCKITVTLYNEVSRTVSLQVLKRGSSQNEKIEKLLKYARKKLGCRYEHGSTGSSTFDCVGFTYWCYKQVGIKLKGTPTKQANDTRFMKVPYDELEPGDLVYFHTDDSSKVSHAALYLGDGEIIHASYTAGKVIISKMHSSRSDYYKRNFSCGRRVFP